MPLSLFAPAKINLFLAITGRRADGFHELVSLVCPLAWGDTLQLHPNRRQTRTPWPVTCRTFPPTAPISC